MFKKGQDPVVAQVQPYRPLETTVEEPQRRDLDKGKQKVVGVQINEPHLLSKSTPYVMTKLDLELEKSRKEKEDLAKELEKVENEAQAVEARRKIMFIKSNSTLTVQPSQPPQALPTAPGVGTFTVGQNNHTFPLSQLLLLLVSFTLSNFPIKLKSLFRIGLLEQVPQLSQFSREN